jgi:hypothetical protein
MKCPTCGTENDAANRFCDQCGSRLDVGAAAPAAQAALAAQPTAAAATCPSCGAVVLPGEAFCDECGASLSGVAAPPVASGASYDAPTVYAPPMPSSAAASAPADGQGPICAACGHQNLAGDRFCDNCGAALTSDGANNSSPQLAEAPPAEPSTPKTEPPAPESLPQKSVSSDMPTAEQPALPSDAGYQAEKQRLDEEIARQQQIITQFEQMQAMFGAAVPPAVTQGLAEARDMLARAQVSLDELKPPAPPVDLAEVKRLEEEIARQQQIITQFEQMQAMFGAAVPPAVVQGLADARDALARAQAELQALTSGGVSAPATAEAVAAPVVSADAPVLTTEPEAPVAAPEAAAPAPESAAASAGAPVIEAPAPPVNVPVPEVPPPLVAPPQPAAAPRLILDEGGKELSLPTDKTEIIIGREDPISGIFPEIDLTPYGGEGGGVSRQHARISRTNGQWTITDLNSTNYTRVDGNKLDPSLPAPIKDGARIQFGRIATTFRE